MNFNKFVFLIIVVLCANSIIAKDVEKKSEKKSKEKSSKKKSGFTGFIVGRLIPDSKFELSILNGFYTPDEASTLCEKNVECSGFTYMGAKGVNQKFEIKFFRIVEQKVFEEAKKSGNWVWTSYRVKRSFVVWFQEKSPKVENTESKTTDKNIAENIKNLVENFQNENFVKSYKWKFPFSVVSVPVNKQIEDSFVLLDNLDSMVNEKSESPKSNFVTIVNLGVETSLKSKEETSVDLCCKKSADKTEIEISNEISGIDCASTSVKSFFKNYVLKTRPVILEECLAVSYFKTWNLQTLAKEFNDNDGGATWTVEDSTTGKVKRIKSEQFPEKFQNPSFIQAQLNHPDVILKVRHLLLDSRDSIGPNVTDLMKELKLIRDSQILFQYWTKNLVSSVISSPKGTDAYVMLLSGRQHWVLIPTADKKDVAKISCKKDCSQGSWIDHILPQLKDNFEIYGRSIIQVLLKPGQTLFIPHGWSYVVKSIEDSLAISEFKLDNGGLELAIRDMPESQIHLLKKELDENDFMRPIWRRFIEVIKQRRSPGKYGS